MALKDTWVDKKDGIDINSASHINEVAAAVINLEKEFENQSFAEGDPTVPTWAKASTKPSYTASEVGAVPTTRTVNGKALSANITLSASDVKADASGAASSAVSAHNADTAAHTDIREQISQLSSEKVNKTYLISVFEELKVLLEDADIAGAIAVLDSAILDLSTLA